MAGGLTPQFIPPQKQSSMEQEIELLKAQSKALAEQLAGIQQRIGELSSKRGDK